LARRFLWRNVSITAVGKFLEPLETQRTEKLGTQDEATGSKRNANKFLRIETSYHSTLIFDQKLRNSKKLVLKKKPEKIAFVSQIKIKF